MITLHRTRLMATDIDATIAFWRDAFGAEVVADLEFAGARNVFLRIGTGRVHLYDQPPRATAPATVHHLGIQTDELEPVVQRLRKMGVSVTDIRHEPSAAYAMAEGPDRHAREERAGECCFARAQRARTVPVLGLRGHEAQLLRPGSP